jgi:phosphoenolpyruvate carboxykinase (GTP)
MSQVGQDAGKSKFNVSLQPPGDGDRPHINRHARAWIDDCVKLCQPDNMVWCDGSKQERDALYQKGVRDGVLVQLNHQKWPGCYYHRSDSRDVARTESQTYICTPSLDMAGPTNNWLNDKRAYAKLRGLFEGCMKGRTMYVVPFVMGPVGSTLARVGIELTDSLYVAVSMGIMTRMGDVAWEQLGESDEFTRCLHSVGDLNPERRHICHFPLDNTIWSFGSGYGGNALLGKKCMALRIASYLGRQQDWMAEHMLLMGVKDSTGRKTYVAAAFPSGCGKTNFAMLIPPEQYRNVGWEITTLGDDIAWMWVDADGKLRAINPETGYFGVVPGTNSTSNPNAVACIAKDTIFTNVALVELDDGTYDVWWEGSDAPPPARAIDWQGSGWTPQSGTRAAHPNSRFTAPMSNNPVLDPAAYDPNGVPVNAIIFGGRRSRTVPLVFQAPTWMHGVYVGATLASERTAAEAGAVGVLQFDPMAMRSFLGYHIRDYLGHWFRMRRKMKDCPRIFHVNWFRRNHEGKFLWPGFGQNMRVLEWIVNRANGRAYAVETAIGWMPRAEDINIDGLEISLEDLRALQTIVADEFIDDLLSQQKAPFFKEWAGDQPAEMVLQRELLLRSL